MHRASYTRIKLLHQLVLEATISFQKIERKNQIRALNIHPIHILYFQEYISNIGLLWNITYCGAWLL